MRDGSNKTGAASFPRPSGTHRKPSDKNSHQPTLCTYFSGWVTVADVKNNQSTPTLRPRAVTIRGAEKNFTMMMPVMTGSRMLG